MLQVQNRSLPSPNVPEYWDDQASSVELLEVPPNKNLIKTNGNFMEEIYQLYASHCETDNEPVVVGGIPIQ